MGANSSKINENSPRSSTSSPPSAPRQPGHDMNVACSICHEPFDESSKCVVTGCGHIFDMNCVAPWARIHRSCPDCRTTLSELSLIRVYFRPIQTNSNELMVLKKKLYEAQLELAKSKSSYDCLLKDNQNLNNNFTTYKNTMSLKLTDGSEALKKTVTSLQSEKKELNKELANLKNTTTQKIKALENKIRFLYKDINLKDKHIEIQSKVMTQQVLTISALKTELEELTATNAAEVPDKSKTVSSQIETSSIDANIIKLSEISKALQDLQNSIVNNTNVENKSTDNPETGKKSWKKYPNNNKNKGAPTQKPNNNQKINPAQQTTDNAPANRVFRSYHKKPANGGATQNVPLVA